MLRPHLKKYFTEKNYFLNILKYKIVLLKKKKKDSLQNFTGF